MFRKGALLTGRPNKKTKKIYPCCMRVSRRCTQDITSDTFFYSLDERYCLACYTSYQVSELDIAFSEWMARWYKISDKAVTVTAYFTNEKLPYWFQCMICGKWREVASENQPPYEFIKNFTCNLVSKSAHENACSVEEDPRVERAQSRDSHENQFGYLPLMANFSVSSTFSNFAEKLGLYPLATAPSNPHWTRVLNEFSSLINRQSVSSVNPLYADSDECMYVPEDVMPESVYVSLRNAIIATWHAFPNIWLTASDVNAYIIYRGLVRIYLMSYVNDIIKFLTQRGDINFGALSPPSNIPRMCDQTVIVVGAGTAGLAAARHLCNLGIKTTILEANNRLGGRVWDDGSFQKGAQFLNGNKNNIFVVLCKQACVKLEELPVNPVFICTDGSVVSPEATENIFVQFCGIMHGTLDLVKERGVDSPWYDIIKHQMHVFLEGLESSDIRDSRDEEEDSPLRLLDNKEKDVYNFMLNLFEIESRTNTLVQTTKYYNFPKYYGSTCFAAKGLMSALDKLSNGLDIKYNQKVISVIYTDDEIKVKTASGEQFGCTKLLLTVPLPILRKELIVFEPRLPESKRKSFEQLADVCYEKVILTFPSMFWRKVPQLCIQNAKFVIVPARGKYFQYFVDVTDTGQLQNTPMLVTFMTSLLWFEDRTEKHVVKRCLTPLKETFNAMGIEVPEPTKCVVSDWYESPNFQTSGSCAKVGCYPCFVNSDICKPVENRLFFAGEAMCSDSANSVAGAFTSGLRESVSIANMIQPVVNLRSEHSRFQILGEIHYLFENS